MGYKGVYIARTCFHDDDDDDDDDEDDDDDDDDANFVAVFD